MDEKCLFSLIQSYASLSPVSGLAWPSSTPSDMVQEVLVRQLIFSKHFQSYSPSANYQRSFWKWVITHLEDQGEEVLENIYSHYLSLLEDPSIGPASFALPPPPSYITYIWRDSSQIKDGESVETLLNSSRRSTLFEARTTIESGTTGLRTWTASFILAEYLMLNLDTFKTSRVLELGSGAGFLGTILAQLQVESLSRHEYGDIISTDKPSLYLTDLNEQVLKRCENNVKLPCNGVASHPALHFKALDWTDALDEVQKVPLFKLLGEINADLIVGADVVYDAVIIPSLVATLHLALNSNQGDKPSKRAIIAATLRNESTLSTFTQQIKDANLCIDEINAVQDGPSMCFLCQPDRIGESGGHVKVFSITNKPSI